MEELRKNAYREISALMREQRNAFIQKQLKLLGMVEFAKVFENILDTTIREKPMNEELGVLRGKLLNLSTQAQDQTQKLSVILQVMEELAEEIAERAEVQEKPIS